MRTLPCFLLALLLSARGFGVEFSLAWDPNPQEEGVVAYKVYHKGEGGEIPVATVTGVTHVRIQAVPGSILTITAWNGSESLHSSDFVVPQAMSIVDIQTGSATQELRTVAYVTLENGDKSRFIRARIVDLFSGPTVEIQQSGDLKTWVTFLYVPLQPGQASERIQTRIIVIRD